MDLEQKLLVNCRYHSHTRNSASENFNSSLSPATSTSSSVNSFNEYRYSASELGIIHLTDLDELLILKINLQDLVSGLVYAAFNRV